MEKIYRDYRDPLKLCVRSFGYLGSVCTDVWGFKA